MKKILSFTTIFFLTSFMSLNFTSSFDDGREGYYSYTKSDSSFNPLGQYIPSGNCGSITYDKFGTREYNEKFYADYCIGRIQDLLNAGNYIDPRYKNAFIENGIDPDTFKLHSNVEGFNPDEARDTLQEVCQYYGEHREDLDEWQNKYNKAFNEISYEDFLNEDTFLLNNARHIIGYLNRSRDYIYIGSAQYNETINILENVYDKCHEIEDKQKYLKNKASELFNTCKNNHNIITCNNHLGCKPCIDYKYENMQNTIESCQATIDFVNQYPGLESIIPYSILNDAKKFIQDGKTYGISKECDNGESTNNNTNSSDTINNNHYQANINNEVTDLNLSNNLDKITNNGTNKTYEGYSNELSAAYDFAYKNKITTTNSIDKAKMNSPLTRIAMAKMLSNYAINVLGKVPDTSKTIKFNDVTEKQNADYDNAVYLAYQLGIMGQNIKNNRFRPNDEVTRAEFGTALSRILFGLTDGTPYYSTHLKQLKTKGIISNDNPNLKELRGYVMLMLMRSAM